MIYSGDGWLLEYDEKTYCWLRDVNMYFSAESGSSLAEKLRKLAKAATDAAAALESNSGQGGRDDG